jgi:hypothetical protein
MTCEARSSICTRTAIWKTSTARRRLDLVKKEAVAEHIARKALARIIADSALWPHFSNTRALAAFWAMPAADRHRIWGDPFDPMEALADFDPKYVHDGHLGAT